MEFGETNNKDPEIIGGLHPERTGFTRRRGAKGVRVEEPGHMLHMFHMASGRVRGTGQKEV
jgi:hypothetical protein